MTSNQVAAEANVIQREANEWLKEHNEEARAETERHNREMEKLQENAVKAQEHGNTIQENWYKWQESWQRDYQYQINKMEVANESKKIEIQEKLAKLDERRELAEESYKAAQEANLTYMQTIASDQLALDKSYKDWMKDFSQKQFELNEYQAFVENKRVEYENALKHEQNVNTYNAAVMQNTYQYALLNWEREKTTKQLQNALMLGNYNYEIGKANVNIAQQNVDLYAKKVKAENFQSYASGLFGRAGIIPGTIGSVESGTKIIRGMTNEKTALKVAESILFKD